MSVQKQLAIYGTGGHALSTLDILQSNRTSDVLSFIEERKAINTFMGYNVYHELKTLSDTLFIAIGNNQLRKDLFLKYSTSDLISVLSSNSTISSFSVQGRHLFVGHHAHIGPGSTIGDNTIINTGAIIEHECMIGQHCHISVNASIAGQVVTGDNVFVGAGATIINNVSVCSDVIIGAGSVVINSIQEPGTYVGVPAKKVSNSFAA